MATLTHKRGPHGLSAQRKLDAVTVLTFYVLLLMAIPSSLVFAPLGSAGGPATLLSVVLMIWYLMVRLHPGFELGTSCQPVRVAGTVFLCSILASYVLANRHFLPRIEQNGADRSIISVVGWLSVLIIAADGIDRVDRLKVLLSRITAGAAGLAMVGVFQFFTGVDVAKYIVIPGLTVNQTPTDLLVRGGFNRPSATTAQPLEFAALMVIVLPLAIHQARFAPPELRIRRWLRVVLVGAAIPMTVSRTALVGLAVTAVVLIPTWSRTDRRRAYAALLVSVAVILIAIPRLPITLISLFGQIATGSASTDSRTTAIAEALPYISQHIWLGRGFGTFPPQIYFFTDDEYLSTLIATGVIGLCGLVGLFLTGWFVARSLRRRSEDVEVRDLAQCLAAAVAVAAACFGTFDVLSFAIASGLTFLIIGCVGAASRLLSS